MKSKRQQVVELLCEHDIDSRNHCPRDDEYCDRIFKVIGYDELADPGTLVEVTKGFWTKAQGKVSGGSIGGEIGVDIVTEAYGKTTIWVPRTDLKVIGGDYE